MHKLTVIYPGGEGVTFDMAYYRTTHMEICFRTLDGLERVEIDEGLPGQPYLAVAHLYFPSLEALQGGLGSPDAGEAATDVPNFTNASPIVQISAVLD